jgi:hypothetical protein
VPGPAWSTDALYELVIRLVKDRDELRERITRLESRMDVRNGRSEGLSRGWRYLVGAVGLVLTLTSITSLVLAIANRAG